MRELVHRSTDQKVGKKQSDVYYFSPEGKKLRSMPEISAYLAKHNISDLSLANFTFAKDCVYREPFEIERDAKHKSTIVSSFSTGKKSNSSTPNKTSSPSMTPKKQSSEKKSSSATSERKKGKSEVNNELNSSNTTELNSSKSPAPKISSSSKKKRKSEIDNQIKKANESQISNTPIKKKRKTEIDNQLEQSNECPVNDTPIKKRTPDSKKSSKFTKTIKTPVKSKSPKRKSSINTDVTSEIIEPSSGQRKQGSVIQTEMESFKINNLTRNNSSNKQTKKTSVKKPLKVKFPFHKPRVLDPDPCTYRCAVAIYEEPKVQCAVCLCLFHQSCVPVFPKGMNFVCKPCASTKLAWYAELRNASSSSPGPYLYDESDIPNLPEDIDTSFLKPDLRLQVQSKELALNHSPTEENISSKPLALVSATSSQEALPQHINSIGAFNYTNPILSSSSSSVPTPSSVPAPFLLSHLTRPSISVSQNVVSSIQPKYTYSKNSRSFIPVHPVSPVVHKTLLPIGTRLPIPQNSNVYPNSVVIRRLPQTGYLICASTSNNNPLTVGNNRQPRMLPKNPIFNSYVQPSQIPPVRYPANLNNNFSANCNILKSMLNSNTQDNEKVIPNNIIRLSPASSSAEQTVLNPVGNAIPQSSSMNMCKLWREYECLNLIFKKLNVYGLQKASQVSTTWRHLANQEILWKNVSLSGIRVTDWNKCCASLQKHNTKSLDLCDIILEDSNDPWKGFTTIVTKLSGIRELMCDKATSQLLFYITSFMPQLLKLECFLTPVCNESEIWSTPFELELACFKSLSKLRTLKVGSLGGIILRNGPKYMLPYLSNLRYLSLTGFKFHSVRNLNALIQQQELVTLELGDCSEVEPQIYEVLEKLTNIKTLRLENGGSIEDTKLSKALMKMEKLEQLELMNFVIPSSLSETLQNLMELVRLNVWPDNSNQSTLVNKNLFQAVSSCKRLKYICWGIIAEEDSVPHVLGMQQEDKVIEYTFEELFNKLVGFFSDCRVEIKCVPRSTWREFCNSRK